MPGRSAALGASWVERVDPAAGRSTCASCRRARDHEADDACPDDPARARRRRAARIAARGVWELRHEHDHEQRRGGRARQAPGADEGDADPRLPPQRRARGHLSRRAAGLLRGRQHRPEDHPADVDGRHAEADRCEQGRLRDRRRRRRRRPDRPGPRREGHHGARAAAARRRHHASPGRHHRRQAARGPQGGRHRRPLGHGDPRHRRSRRGGRAGEGQEGHHRVQRRPGPGERQGRGLPRVLPGGRRAGAARRHPGRTRSSSTSTVVRATPGSSPSPRRSTSRRTAR